MDADDPRHGTLAGFVAHTRAEGPACEPCLTAKRRYEKARLIAGGAIKVSALGTQRRIQALRALGYSLHQIATAGGWACYGSLSYPLRHPTITRATAARVALVYDELCMTPAIGPKARRLQLLAQGNGWLPPLAWDDIDHDLEPAASASASASADQGVVDRVVVERVLAGDVVPTTTAERHAITDRWLDTGRSWNDLEALTGWRHGRYGRTRPSERTAA